MSKDVWAGAFVTLTTVFLLTWLLPSIHSFEGWQMIAAFFIICIVSAAVGLIASDITYKFEKKFLKRG